MGGERSGSSINFDAQKGPIFCEDSLEPMAQPLYCMSRSMDGSKSENSITSEVAERIQTLSSPESKGRLEKRIQSQNGKSESSIASEVSKRIQTLLASESRRDEGMLEKQIQWQKDILSSQNLEDMREKIKRYRPGDGTSEVGGIRCTDFAIPKITTLLVVGHAGAGKSSLINNMIRVLDNVTSGYDRAQTYEEPGSGSLFLQEYYLSRDSRHFCVFDSRGLSNTNVDEDLDTIKKWMIGGVCHGEVVLRPSDSNLIREACEGRGRQGHADWTVKRRVDYAIYVVNALLVHNMRESHDVSALENLAALYKSPFLSFKDDRPVVVMTHGDKLPSKDRVSARIFIGELFGVSPLDQVFDISCFTERSVHPGDVNAVNDILLLKMLEFCLERADRNLPYKTTMSLQLNKLWGAIAERWNELEVRHRLLILIIVSWLLSLVLVLIARSAFHGSRNLGIKHFWKLPKRSRHLPYRF